MGGPAKPYVLPPDVQAMIDRAVAAAPPFEAWQEIALRRAYADAVRRHAERLAAQAARAA